MRTAIEALDRISMARGAIQQIINFCGETDKDLAKAEAGALLPAADVAWLNALDARLEKYGDELEATPVALPTVKL